MSFLPPLRIFLYCVLFVFSVVLLGLSAARLHYTTHLEPFDPLNEGVSFYDPIVAELVATTIFTMLWSPYVIHAIYARREQGFLTTFAGEILGLSVLFLFWIVGAGISTSLWGNLGFCHQYQPCRLLTALVAFTWLGWIVLLMLLISSFLHPLANGGFNEPLHGWVYPRDSVMFPQGPATSEYRSSRA